MKAGSHLWLHIAVRERASAPSQVPIKWNVTNLPQNRFSLVSRVLLHGSSFPYTSTTTVLTTSNHRDVKLGIWAVASNCTLSDNQKKHLFKHLFSFLLFMRGSFFEILKILP